MQRIQLTSAVVLLLLVGIAAASGCSWPPPPPYEEKAKMGNNYSDILDVHYPFCSKLYFEEKRQMTMSFYLRRKREINESHMRGSIFVFTMKTLELYNFSRRSRSRFLFRFHHVAGPF